MRRHPVLPAVFLCGLLLLLASCGEDPVSGLAETSGEDAAADTATAPVIRSYDETDASDATAGQEPDSDADESVQPIESDPRFDGPGCMSAADVVVGLPLAVEAASTPEELRTAAEVYRADRSALVEAAPPEVRTDIERAATVADLVFDLLESYDFDIDRLEGEGAETSQAAIDRLLLVDDERIAARDRILSYLDERCGLDFVFNLDGSVTVRQFRDVGASI
jgi:hypothetical protein